MLAGARLVVGADTGPVHLAAALGTRVVALFGPTDPARNGPLPRGAVLRNAAAEDSTYKRGKTYSETMLSVSCRTGARGGGARDECRAVTTALNLRRQLPLHRPKKQIPPASISFANNKEGGRHRVVRSVSAGFLTGSRRGQLLHVGGVFGRGRCRALCEKAFDALDAGGEVMPQHDQLLAPLRGHPVELNDAAFARRRQCPCQERSERRKAMSVPPHGGDFLGEIVDVGSRAQQAQPAAGLVPGGIEVDQNRDDLADASRCEYCRRARRSKPRTVMVCGRSRRSSRNFSSNADRNSSDSSASVNARKPGPKVSASSGKLPECRTSGNRR